MKWRLIALSTVAISAAISTTVIYKVVMFFI